MGDSDLPIAPYRKHLVALARFGWTPTRQKGSHIVLRHPDKGGIITLPAHKQVKRHTMAQILKAAGISVEDYVDRF